MGCIFLCNMGSDSVHRIDTDLLISKEYSFKDAQFPVGPHDITAYKDFLIVSNNYNNSISVIRKSVFDDGNENPHPEKNIYIGGCPNDTVAVGSRLYVLCGDANNILIYNMEKEETELAVPTGLYPHNALYLEDQKIILTSCIGDDSITIINCELNERIGKIRLDGTPLKIILSQNRQELFVCVSHLGYDVKGFVAVISRKDFRIIAKIPVGFSPADLYEDNGKIYVSNYEGNSVSIISEESRKETGKIEIEGMPRGIIKKGDKLFVGDYLNAVLYVINLTDKKTNIIPVGKEPCGMILV